MYQHVMVIGRMEEPFIISTPLPKSPVQLSECSLHSLNIGGNLMVVEADKTQDFVTFFHDLVCYQIRYLCAGHSHAVSLFTPWCIWWCESTC